MNARNVLTVSELLNGDTYVIPLYQRNFAWTKVEIEQLIRDILDVYRVRENYYIGTLVVHQKDGDYHIIDGQQRTTALTLLALALRNEHHVNGLQAINLLFQARTRSNETLKVLLDEGGLSEQSEGELARGYQVTCRVLREVFKDLSVAEKEDFSDYFFHRVILFKNELPTDLDLNLYFERFNSRGEQLEAHEIIKAQLMGILVKDGEEKARAFSKIWDACAEIDRPVITFFKKKSRPNHGAEEREKIFSRDQHQHEDYNNYHLRDVYAKLTTKTEQTISLLQAIDGNVVVSSLEETQEDLPKYQAVTNFNTLLYCVLYLTTPTQAIQFDDKKLLQSFEEVQKDSEWVERFSENLLTVKFIFDNFIVRNEQSDSGEQETNWVLKKAVRKDENNGGKTWKYVYLREENTFSNKVIQDTILMIQSMFVVTFTSHQDSRWLYDTLSFLFTNREWLHYHNFGEQFVLFLEDLIRQEVQRRQSFFNEDKQLKAYGDLSVLAFNVTDYALWKNRQALQGYVYAASRFRFAYRSSVEHWYPQNPDQQTLDRLDDCYLHSFGNLCLVTNSQNSKFNNLTPTAKYEQWSKKGLFERQSLKLQWMAMVTAKGTWNSVDIKRCEEEILSYVRVFLEHRS